MTTTTTQKKKSPWRFIILGIIAVTCVWIYNNRINKTEKAAPVTTQEEKLQIARDEETQYEVAKRNGSPMDVYVRAGLVAEAYLQANDQEHYKKWKQIEAEAAIAAGLGK